MRKAGIIQYSLIILICSLIIVSCESSKKKDMENLKNLEKEITNSKNSRINENKLQTYIDAAGKYADDYPSDSSSSAYLFKAGRLAMNIDVQDKGSQSVVEIFDKLLNKFPNSKEAPLAMFMKAFYLENNIKNLKLAEETYKEFLKKYPKHVLAPDAQKSIEYMGKPLETIIKEFKEKQ